MPSSQRPHTSTILNVAKTIMGLNILHIINETTMATIAYSERNVLIFHLDFYTSLTRAHFEELCQDLFRSTLEPTKRLFAI
jgi:molecular chaperone DnaK (HSP70)